MLGARRKAGGSVSWDDLADGDPYIEFQLDVTLERSFLWAHFIGHTENVSGGG